MAALIREINFIYNSLFDNVSIVDKDETVQHRMLTFKKKFGDLPAMQNVRAKADRQLVRKQVLVKPGPFSLAPTWR